MMRFCNTYLRIILLIFSVLLSVCLMAQPNRYNENWTFGNYAGVGFAGFNAGAITGSAMASPEGVASISDNGSGVLQYYSNGEKVWGYNHQMLNNGDQLMGSANSTMSAIFAPWPKSTRYTYLFTTDADGGSKGLRYSVIDKDLGTNGGVAAGQKNLLLATPVTEKMAIIRHCDRQSYWLLAHEWGSNRFMAWHIADTGMAWSPVDTLTGPVYSGITENGVGYMKPSPKEDLLALAVTGSDRVDLYYFDNLTGKPGFYMSLTGLYQPYGIEFSTDQTMMYVSCLTGEIWQFNLTAPNIAGSQTLIASTGRLTGALQMAPDSRIYITRDLDPYLGYIGAPGSVGVNCNYVQNGLYLAGRLCEAGLPPYIPELQLNAIVSFTKCLGDTVEYNPGFLLKADSFIFYFGDSVAGTFDTCTTVPARHLFMKTGVHPVRLVYYMCGQEFELKATVCVQSEPGVYLGEDTAICSNNTFNLYGMLSSVYCPTIQLFYQWNTGQTTQSITISPPGQYSLTVTSACGSGSDSITILALPVPVVTLGPDLELCAGDSALLIPDPMPDSLFWNDGSPDSIRVITSSGYFAVTAVNEFNCMSTDDIQITFIDPPHIGWELNDTTICIGHPMELNAGSGFSSYLWQDGSTGAVFLVTDSGWYHVSVSNLCGTDTDSMYVATEDCSLKLFVPNAFTPDGDGANDHFKAYGQYVDDYTLCVFTRWGQQVFCTQSLDEGWDGNFYDRPAPEGTYTWKIVYRDATGETHHLAGTVILYRRYR
ncbi:MAG TPA: gliding motility-associated C-terminal domain-containing protein [Bacteroidales bacterium]|nr:gliding motility-associated C-terminal domain-containing protein [Bacteroidales bacterium]